MSFSLALPRAESELLQRIGFLPWMQRKRFKQTLAAVDCVLDSLHFGGGTTCRLMLNLGLPYITLPGAFGRGRYGMAGYKALGITEPVAESPEDYIAKAVRLAHDRAWYQQLQDEIRSKTRALRRTEQDSAGIAALKGFFRKTLESAV